MRGWVIWASHEQTISNNLLACVRNARHVHTSVLAAEVSATKLVKEKGRSADCASSWEEGGTLISFWKAKVVRVIVNTLYVHHQSMHAPSRKC
jgi:hypothetical protein